MNISIFGLGYVGAVSSACLAKLGHSVVGVDINQDKIDLINNGESPIVEKDLENYIKESVEKKVLRASNNISAALSETSISLICVGTPSRINGSIDLSYIYKVCEQIGYELKSKTSYHLVVIRSTIIPGTISECTKLIEGVSGKKALVDFEVISNPEFLREGTAISDFWNPPYTIIGAQTATAFEYLSKIYEDIDAPIYHLRPEESEMIKYANNNFHAMKVTFANEIGNICKELGVDGHKVMDIVSKDKKLNLSPYYLKPGFAYGGSCLPKDVRGLSYRSKQLDLKSPLIDSLNESNQYQIQRGIDLILSKGSKKVGVLGFSFKADTDDMRESPMVALIETLLGKGYSLSLYDKNVLLSKITGKNKDFLIGHIPHIGLLLKEDPYQVIEESDVLVFGNEAPEFKQLIGEIPQDKVIIDLVRVDTNLTTNGNYEGICW